MYNRKQRKLELPKEIVMRIGGNSTSLEHTRKHSIVGSDLPSIP